MRAVVLFSFLGLWMSLSACAPVHESAPDLQSYERPESGADIARLEALIKKDWDKYRTRPFRTFVGGRSKEYRFARYVEAWRKKIERIGELNYPQAAREQKIYGNLVVTVAIRANGSLEAVQINRSSGFALLDSAALNIVELAAPFEPLSEDIRRDTDILHITRTWTFTRENQLTGED